MKVKRRRKSTRGEEEVSENDAKKEEEKEEKQIYYPRSIYFFSMQVATISSYVLAELDFFARHKLQIVAPFTADVEGAVTPDVAPNHPL